MAEPWPTQEVFRLTDRESERRVWCVTDDIGKRVFRDESAARRYAALPVLLALVREACSRPRCGFCGPIELTVYTPVYMHSDDCPGVAALKAAGEGP